MSINSPNFEMNDEKGCYAFNLIIFYSSNRYQEYVFLTIHFLNGKWRHSSIAIRRRLDLKCCHIKSFTSSFSWKEVVVDHFAFLLTMIPHFQPRFLVVHHFAISSCADMSCESCQFASSYLLFTFSHLLILHLLISKLPILHLLISHLLILHLLSCSSPIHHFSTIQRLDRPVECR